MCTGNKDDFSSLDFVRNLGFSHPFLNNEDSPCRLESGEIGKAANGKVLHYKGTPFHRIIPGFMIQGGDIVSGDGRGNQSIFGGTFRDENFKLKHSHAGFTTIHHSLRRLNSQHAKNSKIRFLIFVFCRQRGHGEFRARLQRVPVFHHNRQGLLVSPDSQCLNDKYIEKGSKFVRTCLGLGRLDGEHVVFGKVIDGMDTVYAIEGSAGTYSGKPRKKVIISDSGEIPKSKWDEDTRVSVT